MKPIITLESADGKIAFEVDIQGGGVAQIATPDKLVTNAEQALERLTMTVRKCTLAISTAFQSLREQGVRDFESAEAEFGIKVTASGDIFVAKGSAEANIRVKLVWKSGK